MVILMEQKKHLTIDAKAGKIHTFVTIFSKNLKENSINLDRIRMCQCSVKQANTSERCHTQTNKLNSPQINRNPTLRAAHWLKTSCTSNKTTSKKKRTKCTGKDVSK